MFRPIGKAAPVILIGDVHGQSSKLTSLWNNIKCFFNDSESFKRSTVIFLGDYVDRGPDTYGAIELMLNLKHQYTNMNFHFICGNHDFALARFLDGKGNYSNSIKDYVPKHKTEQLYNGEGSDHMHLQGLRYAGTISRSHATRSDSIYDAGTTFSSYKVPYNNRQQLIQQMPLSHRAFIDDLLLVYDEIHDVFGRVIAVHAGLEQNDPEKQISMLKDKSFIPSPWIEPLMGRRNVRNMPLSFLAHDQHEQYGHTPWVISGHHEKCYRNNRRIIMDACGGKSKKKMGAAILIERSQDWSSINQIRQPDGVTSVAMTHCTYCQGYDCSEDVSIAVDLGEPHVDVYHVSSSE
jgi:hypothetical protein